MAGSFYYLKNTSFFYDLSFPCMFCAFLFWKRKKRRCRCLFQGSVCLFSAPVRVSKPIAGIEGIHCIAHDVGGSRGVHTIFSRAFFSRLILFCVFSNPWRMMLLSPFARCRRWHWNVYASSLGQMILSIWITMSIFFMTFPMISFIRFWSKQCSSESSWMGFHVAESVRLYTSSISNNVL